MLTFMRGLFRQAIISVTQTDEDVEAYLVSLGFRVEHPDREWRCGGGCNSMQKPSAAMVWVEDGAMRGDPMWSVVSRQRRHAYNGYGTAWCLACCRSFKPMTPEEMAKADSTPHDPIPTIPITCGSLPANARPFVQGMTLLPGESVVLTIPLAMGAVDPGDGGSSE